jgi:hypothetical protein
VPAPPARRQAPASHRRRSRTAGRLGVPPHPSDLIKKECLDRVIPLGERHVRPAVTEFVARSSRTESPGTRQSADRGDTRSRRVRPCASSFAVGRTALLLRACCVTSRSAEMRNITGSVPVDRRPVLGPRPRAQNRFSGSRCPCNICGVQLHYSADRRCVRWYVHLFAVVANLSVASVANPPVTNCLSIRRNTEWVATVVDPPVPVGAQPIFACC